MVHDPLYILIAEDLASDAELVMRELRRAGLQFKASVVDSKDAFANALETLKPDIVLSDYSMPEFSGLEALNLTIAHDRELPFIIVTGSVNEETAVACLRAGAWDYVLKDHLGRLPFALREALALRKTRLANRETEEELRRNVAKYRDLYYNAPTMLATVDPASLTVVECNQSLIMRTGFSATEIIGSHILERYHPSCRDAAEELFAQHHKLGRANNAKLDLLSILGGKIPVLANVASVHDGRGRILNYRMAWQDITELVRAEQELQHREQRYRAVSDSAVDAIISMDDSGIIIGWNPGAQRTFGYTEEEAIGQSVESLIPEDQKVRTGAGLKWLNERDEERVLGKTIEVAGKRNDGSKFPAEMSLSSWQNAGGRFYTAIMRDISERKRVESTMVLQSTALDAAANAIVITNRTGSIEWVNQAFVTLTGYSADEALGKNPRSLLNSGKQNEALYKEFWTTILSGQVWRGELINRKKDGSTYIEYQTVTPVRSATGAIDHFIEIRQDITERRHAEEAQRETETQLRQTQKLESLGTLASGIAHDFNNILGIILAHCSILESRAADPLLKSSTEAINQSVNRGASLVKQLLTFARKGEVHIGPISVNDIIQELVKLLRETFQKSIVLRVELATKLPFIAADSTQLHQVLLNLCVNARDAMPEGGTLAITSEHHRTHSIPAGWTNASEGEHVVVSISDTGIGMDSETQQRVFEPFFTTKHRDKGTGLGLSTVYGIMESHKGFVTIESVPGKGTTFRCHFPIPRQNVETRTESSGPETPTLGGTETVLFVEDEAMLRDPIKGVLAASGYNVLIAIDGKEAFELFQKREGEIQLIISDLDLPKFNGVELFRKVKNGGSRIPFILASGFFDPATKSLLIEEGIRDLQQKPYNPGQLLKSIRNVLDSALDGRTRELKQ